MERISKVQNGTLFLRITHLDEYGLEVGVEFRGQKRTTDVIWWDTKKEMVRDLKEVLRRLEPM